jgi:hypothetical protein
MASAPLSDPEPDDDLAAWRAIPLARWYVEVAEANPHRCQHDGPCGDRLLCDREEHRTGGYPTVELLASGVLLFHCENRVVGPTDPEYRRRRGGLVARVIA